MTDEKKVEFEATKIRVCFEVDCPSPKHAEASRKNVCLVCMNKGVIRLGVPILEFMEQVKAVARQVVQEERGRWKKILKKYPETYLQYTPDGREAFVADDVKPTSVEFQVQKGGGSVYVLPYAEVEGVRVYEGMGMAKYAPAWVHAAQLTRTLDKVTMMALVEKAMVER